MKKKLNLAELKISSFTTYEKISGGAAIFTLPPNVYGPCWDTEYGSCGCDSDHPLVVCWSVYIGPCD